MSGVIAILGGSGASYALRQVATDVGTSPSTTRITLGSVQNSVRVFCDLYSPSEPFFYLYFTRNGGTTVKVKLFPWSARILSASPGDAFAFSTADGRSVTIAPVTVPTTLESSFPVTGTALADSGTPPYWSPSAAHVTLLNNSSAFRLPDTSSSTLVFISEYDPRSKTWTPPRWVRTQSGRATTVRCTYKQIALATRDGSTLSIAAPTGATIGGVSTRMVNPYLPAVTGTSRPVTNATTLLAAIAASVAGDEIVLAAGTYTLSQTVTTASFTANNGVGRPSRLRGDYHSRRYRRSNRCCVDRRRRG